MNSITMDSPIGFLTLTGTSGALTSICFGNMGYAFNPSELLLQVVSQLREYFDGKRQSFDVPMEPVGTEFQKKYGLLWGKSPMARRVPMVRLRGPWTVPVPRGPWDLPTTKIQSPSLFPATGSSVRMAPWWAMAVDWIRRSFCSNLSKNTNE